MDQSAKRPKRRRYNTRLIKATQPYRIPAAAKLLDVHKNAISRWIKDGLKIIDAHKPYLIRGSDLIAYLDAKQSARRTPCPPGAFYCLRCRAPRWPLGGMVDIIPRTAKAANLRALCEACEATMHRITSTQKLDDIRRRYVTQTLAPKRMGNPADPRLNGDLKGV